MRNRLTIVALPATLLLAALALPACSQSWFERLRCD
jgi:hypothetical protein